MKFSAALTLFAAVAVNAGCGNPGHEDWPNKDDALNQATNLCNDPEKIAGNFVFKQTKYHCVDSVQDGWNYELQVRYENNDDGGRLEASDCIAGFQRVLDNCPAGGEIPDDSSTWYFMYVSRLDRLLHEC